MQEKINLEAQKGINQCKASRQLKKHIENTYKRHLKIKFEQYKRQCRLFEQNENKFRKMIRHAQRRQLKQAFEKVQKKLTELTKVEGQEIKVQEMREKKKIQTIE